MQQSNNTEQSETVLHCEECGNKETFDTVKTYFHKAILNGAGLVESSRIESDLEGEELDITCRKCGNPVEMQPPKPFAQTIDDHLDAIDDQQRSIMDAISVSTEISLEAGEDIGVAACAFTDAVGEVRTELERHSLYPSQNGTDRHAG